MTDTAQMTAQIVAAYAETNKLSPTDLTTLIADVHRSLTNVGQPETPVVEAPAKPTSAQIRKSISDQGLVSFLDGRTYQSLKRHLTARNMTPAEYRSTFGLPDSYPMVSPAYAAKRSELAKSIGLGQKRQPAPAPEPEPAPPAKKTRARKAPAS